MAHRLLDPAESEVWAGNGDGLGHRIPELELPVRDRVRERPAGFSARRFLTLQLVAKRAMDVVIATGALIALLPFLGAVAAAIRIESPGSPIFSQYRWGKDGKRIRIYKFRTMRSDLCDSAGTIQATENDPRVTPLGRILRSSSIDELPQLVNVIKGEMSLVGPRCHAIGMLAMGVPYEEFVPYYHQRHSMRPGITGLAQIRGWRGPTKTAVQSRARIESDIHYINNFSLWLDLKILAETVRREIIGGNGF